MLYLADIHKIVQWYIVIIYLLNINNLLALISSTAPLLKYVNTGQVLNIQYTD